MDTTETGTVAARSAAEQQGAARPGPGRLWQVWAAVLAVMTAVHFVLPEDVQSEWLAVAGMLAPAAIITGLVAHGPTRASHWWLLATGVLLLGGGDLIWSLWEDLIEPEVPFPSWPDALYLSAYPFILLALIVIVRRRIPGGDLPSLLDATVVSIGVGLAIWVFLIDPLAQASTGFAARAVSVAYPAADVLLLACALRLAFVGGRKAPSYWALMAALVITIVADVSYGLAEVSGSYSTGDWTDAAYIAAYGCWGLVALHPSMRTLHEVIPEATQSRVVSRPRLVVLGIASLTAPGVLAIQFALGGPLHLPVVVSVSAILIVLVVIRLAGLMHELSGVALTDSLTGLPNRAALLPRLRDLVRDSDPASLAVLFIDLDRFKDVNDSLGHAAGDRLLVEVSSRLRHVLRGDDLVARFGGDEFVIVASVRDVHDACLIAERVLECLKDPIWLAGSPIFPGASVGVALTTTVRDDPDMLVADADVAMFRAKARGRGCFEVFDDSMRGGASERLMIEAELREALARDELRVHYQPIVTVPHARLVGYEALLRWYRRDGEVRLPGTFLTVAEETGLIVPIGERILEEVLSDLRRWHEASPDRPLTVTVNMSTRQLAHQDLIPMLQRALTRHAVDPHRLYIEVVEQVLVDDEMVLVLDELRDLGFRLAIDDFGTGYSSLQRLRRVRFDLLKIDRSYVSSIDDPDSRAIVQAILAMVKALDMHVVAEGVETEEQLTTLARLGCPMAQGYLLGRPRPVLADVADIARGAGRDVEARVLD